MAQTVTCECGWQFRVAEGAPGGRVPCVMCGTHLDVPKREGRLRLVEPRSPAIFSIETAGRFWPSWLTPLRTIAIVFSTVWLIVACIYLATRTPAGPTEPVPPAVGEFGRIGRPEALAVENYLMALDEAVMVESDAGYGPLDQDYIDSFQKMFDQGRLFAVPSGTRVRVMDQSGRTDSLKVQLLDGPFPGVDGWVRKSWVQPEGEWARSQTEATATATP